MSDSEDTCTYLTRWGNTTILHMFSAQWDCDRDATAPAAHHTHNYTPTHTQTHTHPRTHTAYIVPWARCHAPHHVCLG